jgi:hypothetical protein
MKKKVLLMASFALIGLVFIVLGCTPRTNNAVPATVEVTIEQAVLIPSSDITEDDWIYCPEENVYWIISEGGGITITGFTGTNTDVHIPPQIQGMPVTGIGDEAFIGAWIEAGDRYLTIGHQLTSVIIPDTVAHIGDGAFANNLLTSIAIPDSVTHIGREAFASNLLTSVTIPSGVTYIRSAAFASNQLTSVNIPSNVVDIGDWAFSGNQLASVTIPDSVVTIGFSAFTRNQLTGITIPDSVLSIDFAVFSHNQITIVVIGSNLDIHPTVFDSEFVEFYQANGRRAGTYTLINGGWSFEPRQ